MIFSVAYGKCSGEHQERLDYAEDADDGAQPDHGTNAKHVDLLSRGDIEFASVIAITVPT